MPTARRSLEVAPPEIRRFRLRSTRPLLVMGRRRQLQTFAFSDGLAALGLAFIAASLLAVSARTSQRAESSPSDTAESVIRGLTADSEISWALAILVATGACWLAVRSLCAATSRS
ncbi:MAG: hypothetical protein ABL997_00935 [Planctomycetota bacterium]